MSRICVRCEQYGKDPASPAGWCWGCKNDNEADHEIASLRTALAKAKAWARLWKDLAANKRCSALYASMLHAEQRAKKDAARAARDHGVELLQDLVRRVAKVEPFGTFDGLCDQIENCIDAAREACEPENKMIREHEATKWRLRDAGVTPP